VTSKTCQIVGFFRSQGISIIPEVSNNVPCWSFPFLPSREIHQQHPCRYHPHFQISTSASEQPRIQPLPSSISSDFHAPCLTFHIHMQVRLLCISTPLFQRSIARSISTQLKPQFHIQPIINKRKYTMAQAMHGHSAACCNIPPIISKGYEPKGRYETIGGLKTCKFCSIPPQPDLHLHLHYQLLTNRTNRRHRPSQCL
jgi:hypothetical protein